MIQIWNDDGDTTKYAHFSGGAARFATLTAGASADDVRSALLASDDVRVNIQPDPSRPILWHEEDRPTITAYFNRQIDAIQDAFLMAVVEGNRGRITVYQLKSNEMMAIAAGLDEQIGTPILDAESGGDPDVRSELIAAWSQRGAAWLAIVGASERALRLTKQAIAAAADDLEMRQIVASFKDTLRGINE